MFFFEMQYTCLDVHSFWELLVIWIWEGRPSCACTETSFGECKSKRVWINLNFCLLKLTGRGKWETGISLKTFAMHINIFHCSFTRKSANGHSFFFKIMRDVLFSVKDTQSHGLLQWLPKLPLESHLDLIINYLQGFQCSWEVKCWIVLHLNWINSQ